MCFYQYQYQPYQRSALRYQPKVLPMATLPAVEWTVNRNGPTREERSCRREANLYDPTTRCCGGCIVHECARARPGDKSALIDLSGVRDGQLFRKGHASNFQRMIAARNEKELRELPAMMVLFQPRHNAKLDLTSHLRPGWTRYLSADRTMILYFWSQFTSNQMNEEAEPAKSPVMIGERRRGEEGLDYCANYNSSIFFSQHSWMRSLTPDDDGGLKEEKRSRKFLPDGALSTYYMASTWKFSPESTRTPEKCQKKKIFTAKSSLYTFSSFFNSSTHQRPSGITRFYLPVPVLRILCFTLWLPALALYFTSLPNQVTTVLRSNQWCDQLTRK